MKYQTKQRTKVGGAILGLGCLYVVGYLFFLALIVTIIALVVKAVFGL